MPSAGCAGVDEPLAGELCLAHRLRPLAGELQDLGPVHQALAAVEHQLGLRRAPPAQRGRPLADPAQVEDLVAGLDDGAVDDPARDRPDLAGRRPTPAPRPAGPGRPPGRRRAPGPGPARAGPARPGRARRTARRSRPPARRSRTPRRRRRRRGSPSAVGSMRKPRSAQSAPESATSRCERATQPLPRAVSPRSSSAIDSQKPQRAARTGSPGGGARGARPPRRRCSASSRPAR